MQKVIRATERAKTQARRRNLIRRAEEHHRLRSELRKHEALKLKDDYSTIKAARLARREDWLLGPLAPRRDLGSSKDTYGTVDSTHVQHIPKRGKIRDHCIAEGDRVVIVGDFPDQGLIGKVRQVKVGAETCMVEGLNMVDIATPEHMLKESENQDPIRTTEAPFPLSAVRLVFPLRHAETGAIRDVIIKELKRTPISERKQGRDGRYVADTEPHIYIPFPETEKEDQPEHEIDTLRIEVEEKTWTPTLTRPPMPPSVIDELRNKYSIFRDRHDESWVKAREKLAAEREREARVREEMMLTPLEELHRLKKLKKSEVVKEPLDSEILMRIGELMAENKERLARAKEEPRIVRFQKMGSSPRVI